MTAWQWAGTIMLVGGTLWLFIYTIGLWDTLCLFFFLGFFFIAWALAVGVIRP